MDNTASGNDILTVTGSGDQFAVVYSTVAADGSIVPIDGSSNQKGNAGVGASPFGAPDASDAPNSGQVYTVTSGNSHLTVDGDNKQFVVQYLVPASADPSSTGHNTVDVQGANSKFVVAYNTAGAGSGGNAVNVSSGGNKFAVAYNDPSQAGGNSVATSGDSNLFVVAYNDASTNGGNAAAGSGVTLGGDSNKFVVANNEAASSGGAASNPNAVTVGGGGNQFVVADNQPASSGGASSAGSAVTINGSGNQYVVMNPGSTTTSGANDAPTVVIDPASSGSAATTIGCVGGSPAFGENTVSTLGSSNQFVVAYGSADNTAASAPSAASDIADSGTGGAMTSADLNAMLASSPFGALLDLPGISSFASIFGGLPSGAPLAAGPPAAGDSLAALGSGSSNPFAALFGGGNASPATAAPATGDSASGATSDSGTASADPLGALLAASPFGPLVDFLGVQGLEKIFSGLAGNGGGNPLASLGSGGIASLFGGTVGGSVGAAPAPAVGASTSTVASGSAGGADSSDSLGALLAQSPFAPLVSILGVQGVEEIFTGMGSGTNSVEAPGGSGMASLLASLSSASGSAAGSTAGAAGAPTSEELSALLAQSPLAPLVSTIGVQSLETIFGNLSSEGVNPFANLTSAQASTLFAGLASGANPSAAPDGSVTAATAQALFGSILSSAVSADATIGAAATPAAGAASAIAAAQQTSSSAIGANLLQSPSASTV